MVVVPLASLPSGFGSSCQKRQLNEMRTSPSTYCSAPKETVLQRLLFALIIGVIAFGAGVLSYRPGAVTSGAVPTPTTSTDDEKINQLEARIQAGFTTASQSLDTIKQALAEGDQTDSMNSRIEQLGTEIQAGFTTASQSLDTIKQALADGDQTDSMNSRIEQLGTEIQSGFTTASQSLDTIKQALTDGDQTDSMNSRIEQLGAEIQTGLASTAQSLDAISSALEAQQEAAEAPAADDVVPERMARLENRLQSVEVALMRILDVNLQILDKNGDAQ